MQPALRMAQTSMGHASHACAVGSAVAAVVAAAAIVAHKFPGQAEKSKKQIIGPLKFVASH